MRFIAGVHVPHECKDKLFEQGSLNGISRYLKYPYVHWPQGIKQPREYKHGWFHYFHHTTEMEIMQYIYCVIYFTLVVIV